MTVETRDTGPLAIAQKERMIAPRAMVSLKAINIRGMPLSFMSRSSLKTLGRAEMRGNIVPKEMAVSEYIFQKET